MAIDCTKIKDGVHYLKPHEQDKERAAATRGDKENENHIADSDKMEARYGGDMAQTAEQRFDEFFDPSVTSFNRADALTAFQFGRDSYQPLLDALDAAKSALDRYQFKCERGYCGHEHRDQLPKCHVEGCECISFINKAFYALAKIAAATEGKDGD